MKYLALLLAFASGGIGMYALILWAKSLDDWRPDAALAAFGLAVAVLLAVFA